MGLTTPLEFALEGWDRPEKMKALVLEGFGSPDSAIRLTALGVAAEGMDDELAAEVVRLLDTDPEVEVRARAAIALGPALEEMGDEEGWEEPDLEDPRLSMDRFHEIERRLERLYRDASEPEEVRRRVLEASVRSPRPWHQEAVLSAWTDDDPEWRLTAVFCMGYTPGFEDEILEAFDSDSPELKLEAVRTISIQGLEEGGDQLVELVASERTPRELRIAAIDALAAVRPQGGTEVLDSLLMSDDEEIAEAAQEAFDELAIWDTEEMDDFEL